MLLIVFTISTGWLSACNRAPPARGQAPLDSPRLAELLGSAALAGYPQALPGRAFRFPADHGPHADFRNEWWYFTGNLQGSDGQRFGYELTLFRFRLTPTDVAAGDSRWATNQLYVGHLAVTDVAAESFRVAERQARGALGLAGADDSPVHVWLHDWSIRREARSGRDRWQLHAREDDIGVSLTLEAGGAPVLHGEGGWSRKSAQPGNASYYYSVPRLLTAGTLTSGAREFTVSGLSWLDREWSSSALAADQQGWDWFSLQLDDGSNLMFYQLRTLDGGRDPHSAGTWMPASAAPRHLAGDEVEIDVLAHWQSPSGRRYPIDWRLRVPSIPLELRVRPVLENQELETWVRYWEGAVDVSGRRGEQTIDGRGYVEMTGYRAPSADEE